MKDRRFYMKAGRSIVSEVNPRRRHRNCQAAADLGQSGKAHLKE